MANGDGKMTHEQHQNVSSLVSDLVQMAEATRRLPEVERELTTMREASSRDGDTIARLERKLMDRSAEIDELRAKLRSAEVERDDAGFRELEAQDKVNALRDEVEGVLSSLGQTLGVIDGTDRIRVVRMTEIDRGGWLEFKIKRDNEWKAQQERPTTDGSVTSNVRPEDGNASAASEGESKPLPFSPESQPTNIVEVREEPNPTLDQAAPIGIGTNNIALSTEPTSGQSDPLPIAPTQPIPEPVISTTATSQDGATSSEPLPEAISRYAGKKYYDHPYYVSEESWVANGGTLEDYFWRPIPNIA